MTAFAFASLALASLALASLALSTFFFLFLALLTFAFVVFLVVFFVVFLVIFLVVFLVIFFTAAGFLFALTTFAHARAVAFGFWTFLDLLVVADDIDVLALVGAFLIFQGRGRAFRVRA